MMNDPMIDDRNNGFPRSSDYPKSYQSELRNLGKWMGILLILLAVTAFIMRDSSFMFVNVGFFALGIWFVLVSRAQWIILRENAIEIGGLVKPRAISRADIIERKLHSTGRGDYYILILKNKKKAHLPMFMRYDSFFYAWMKSIPLAKRNQKRNIR